jgi:hypothetical protein
VGSRTHRYKQAAEAGAKATNGRYEPPPEPWSPPVPFGRPGDVPPFPVEALPPWLAGWVAAEAEATQTPPDLAGSLALSLAGAALAGKARVRVRDGWTEPANVFTVVALPPGERKSAVFSDATAPLVQYEREERERMEPVIAEMESEHRVMEMQLRGLEQKAAKESAKKDDAEAQEEARRLKAEAKELAKRLAQHDVPDLPEFFTDDVTPEKLVQLIVRQGGRMLLASPEGTTFEIAKGRYSETANFEVYLKGHAGDPLRTGRVGRESDRVDRPALSCALAVQPDVIRGLAEQASMRGRGFLARWLYGLPASNVGNRTTAPAAVSPDVARGYAAGMLALWRLPKHAFAGHECAWELELSAEADGALQTLERWLEPQLAEGEPLAALAGWANKLAGAVARLALILHMAGTAGAGAAWNEPIGPETVEAAITLGRDYYLPHAWAAFAQMGADDRERDAARVVGWLANLGNCETVKLWKGVRCVSRADIHRNVFGGSRTADEVGAVCRLLTEHGYIRPAGSSWRRDVQLYELNPDCPTEHGDE